MSAWAEKLLQYKPGGGKLLETTAMKQLFFPTRAS